jgi:lysylphosphatidylglycerol synthetase-like protein (DUF2156 family)
MKRTIAFISATGAYLLSVGGVFAASPGTSFSITPGTGYATTGIELSSIPGFIFTLLLLVGVVIAVAFLIYGGIKWVLSGGDKAAVDAARKHIVAAIIGLVIIVLAFVIVSFVFQLLGVGNPLTGNFCIPTLMKPNC